MGRMSAMHFAREIEDYTPADVYDIWSDMGMVIRSKSGGWIITELGHRLGGRYSKSSYSVPTFVFEKVFPLMEDFYRKHKLGK